MVKIYLPNAWGSTNVLDVFKHQTPNNDGVWENIKAVNSKEFNSIFSLNHPKCYGIIKRYQILLLEEEQNRQETEVKVNPKRRNKGYGKKNLLSKLRQRENGEKEIEDNG